MNPSDVPSGPLLVDTDVVSYLLSAKGPHAGFAQLVRGHVLVISFATVGELLGGAHKAGWGAPRVEQLETRLRS